MIDFLLIGHSKPSVPLDTLTARYIFEPATAVDLIVQAQYMALKPYLQLGFSI
jgi:hypothetical protein